MLATGPRRVPGAAVEPKSQTGPDWMKVEAPAAQRSGTTFVVTGGVAGSINSQPQVSGEESPAPAATGLGKRGVLVSGGAPNRSAQDEW